MYKITYYGHELGDMEDVNVAITFESAVADVLIRLGRSQDYQVTASVTEGDCSLQVSRQGVTIASVVTCEVVCYTGSNNPVHGACSALRAGDDNLIVKLFCQPDPTQ